MNSREPGPVVVLRDVQRRGAWEEAETVDDLEQKSPEEFVRARLLALTEAAAAETARLKRSHTRMLLCEHVWK